MHSSKVKTIWFLQFKGGTTQKKIYFEDYCYSEDLDFTLLNEDKHLGIELYGVTHNALHDVRSILVSVKHLVKNGAYIPFVR